MGLNKKLKWNSYNYKSNFVTWLFFSSFIWTVLEIIRQSSLRPNYTQNTLSKTVTKDLRIAKSHQDFLQQWKSAEVWRVLDWALSALEGRHGDWVCSCSSRSLCLASCNCRWETERSLYENLGLGQSSGPNNPVSHVPPTSPTSITSWGLRVQTRGHVEDFILNPNILSLASIACHTMSNTFSLTFKVPIVLESQLFKRRLKFKILENLILYSPLKNNSNETVTYF